MYDFQNTGTENITSFMGIEKEIPLWEQMENSLYGI